MPVHIDEIAKLISRQLGIKQVTADHRLREDLGAESLDIQNIVAILEDKYSISVQDAQIADLNTVADVHGLLPGGS